MKPVAPVTKYFVQALRAFHMDGGYLTTGAERGSSTGRTKLPLFEVEPAANQTNLRPSTFIGHEVLSAVEGAAMAEPLTHKLIRSHLAEGKMDPGEEIALKMDQALLQDATGTLAWLEFEQMQRPSVTVRQATQYIDPNLLQTGYENADDHRFLRSACQRYGAVFSGPGNGISHWAHMEAYDIPV